MPSLRTRDSDLTDWREDGRVIEAGGVHKLNQRCFWAINGHRRSARRAKETTHRATTVGLHCMRLQGLAMELQPVGWKDQAGSEGAAAGSLTIPAVTDQLNKRPLAAGVSHRAAGATALNVLCHRSPLLRWDVVVWKVLLVSVQPVE
jgi:hypothetical protein